MLVVGCGSDGCFLWVGASSGRELCLCVCVCRPRWSVAVPALAMGAG